MLQRIKVSGFKSLERFELEFNQGLNILIGPNGSGKTNIINFIEFLSFLSRDSLLEAVRRSGGAGRIFRRNLFGSLTKKISFEIEGVGNYAPIRKNEFHRASYKFSADIDLSENNSAIYFSRQRLQLAPNEDKISLLHKWPIDIEVDTTSEEETKTTFHALDKSLVGDAFVSRREDPSIEDIQKQISQYCGDFVRSRTLYQMLDRFVDSAGAIERDLFGAQSFNISPSIVRTPEDIASEPEIAQDGRGLAATLFALSSAREGYFLPYVRYRMQLFENPDHIMKAIISYSKLVNDSIESIYVAPDTVEAKLRIFLTLRIGQDTMNLPFSLASDGTAKWFALVTAIMTTSSIFAIEEPENYLHPLMQKEIVNIVRSNFEVPNKQAFAVMTTHSETILNSIDPNDMVLVHMDDGRTIAKRPQNVEDIRNEIRSTGFGAGYYYIAGAIE